MQLSLNSHRTLCFALIWLAMTTGTAAAEDKVADCGQTPENLKLALQTSSGFLADAFATELPRVFHEIFLLTVENIGTADCRVPLRVDQVWKINVHQQGLDVPLPWIWFDDRLVISPPGEDRILLHPKQPVKVTAEWAGTKPGTYIIEATFLPTWDQKVLTEEFSLPLSHSSVDILFTGKLMGYYRLPHQQQFNVNKTLPCTAPNSTDSEAVASPDADVFIKNFIESSNDNLSSRILVGTGDNFAPNYYSRVLVNSPTHTSEPGKELWEWDPGNSTWDWYRDAIFQNSRGTIPTDNVACFLSYVNYDAIVPGKHDFYYGPERLRELARFLASMPTYDRFKPVQMLAANMMIKTAWANDHEPIPDSGKPRLPFVTKYVPPTSASTYQNLEIANFTDGGFAFPWMQFVRITAKRRANVVGPVAALPVWVCEADPKDPDNFLLPTNLNGVFCRGQRPLGNPRDPNRDPVAANATDAAQMDSGVRDPAQFVYTMPALVAGKNYAVCIPDPDNTPKSRPYCLRFSVYTPFLQYGLPVNDYANPKLYVLKNDGKEGETPVVIFGVVDPQLILHVGGDNFAWQTVRAGERNDAASRNMSVSREMIWEKKYNTEVTIADPVQTLVHLEDYFESEHKDFHGMRVLLAQMPPEEAKQLAEHLPKCVRFDVIISAADDGLATPNQILRIPPSGTQGGGCPSNRGASGLKMKGKNEMLNGTLVTPPTFIAVPPTHEQLPAVPPLQQRVSNGQLSRFLQVRKLRVRSDSDGSWNYVLSGVPISVPLPGPKSYAAATSAFWKAVCEALHAADGRTDCGTVVGWDDASKKVAIQQLTLWSIRSKEKADVALLQERDFYLRGLEDYFSEHCNTDQDNSTQRKLACDDPHSLGKLGLQEILDRILWKGDFIKVRAVTGSVLRSILKESDQFAKIEKTAYLSVSETGRPLVTLGLRADVLNAGDFLINGKPLDPGALYTIATSDYIALGDTGYPELAMPPVGGPPQPASPSGKIITVSGNTCRDVYKLAPTAFSSDCAPPLPRRGYYDEIADRTPPDPRKGNTSWHKFYAWTFLHGELGQPTPKNAQVPPDNIGAEMQKGVDAQPNWDFSLEKMSVGFSALTHTDSEQTLSQEFGGVQNSQVNAKHSHSWDWDANSKFTLFHPKLDWFLSEGLQYSSSFQAQLTGPSSETQSRNLFAVDGGSYLHPWSNSKDLPQLSLVLSGHFETQVGNPITNINLNPVPPSTNSSTLTFKQGRTNLLLGRTGLRWQDRKSYVEGGLEGGQTLNAIERFDVLSSGGPLVPCLLEASLSLTKCLNNFNKSNPSTPVTPTSAVSVVRKPQDRYGAYWTMGVTVPINPTISYNFQDTSDYFFLSKGDNSADTRFRHQLVHTFKFTVFPNLSFEPTYTMFFYENKLDYHFLFQQQYSVKINYSFDWSNWHESKSDLSYKKPSPQ